MSIPHVVAGPASSAAQNAFIDQCNASAAVIAAEAAAWTAYTPSWNGTIGNGTLNGRWIQVGNVVHFEAGLTGGSTTTWTGSQWNFGLPLTAAQPGAPLNDGYAGDIKMFDNSASQTWVGHASISSAGTVVTCHTNASPVGGVTSTGPFTWATSDRLVIIGSYEPA